MCGQKQRTDNCEVWGPLGTSQRGNIKNCNTKCGGSHSSSLILARQQHVWQRCLVADPLSTWAKQCFDYIVHARYLQRHAVNRNQLPGQVSDLHAFNLLKWSWKKKSAACSGTCRWYVQNPGLESVVPPSLSEREKVITQAEPLR